MNDIFILENINKTILNEIIKLLNTLSKASNHHNVCTNQSHDSHMTVSAQFHSIIYIYMDIHQLYIN